MYLKAPRLKSILRPLLDDCAERLKRPRRRGPLRRFSLAALETPPPHLRWRGEALFVLSSPTIVGEVASRARQSSDDDGGSYTATLSIRRVLPSRAAASRRRGAPGA